MSKYQSKYQVIVGNVGTVYDGDSERDAISNWWHYVEQSQSGTGRASQEDVSLFEDGEPEREYHGSGE